MPTTVTFATDSESVSVTGSVVYATKYTTNRYGQTAEQTVDGEMVTVDNNGLNVIEGIIVITSVEYDEGEALRAWLRDDAVFRQEAISISSDCAELDLGLGKDVAITNANFSKNNDKGVFKLRAPKRFDIKFPYSVVMEEE